MKEQGQDQRWTAKRKAVVVLEVLKGRRASVDARRKYGIKQGELEEWTERFLEAGGQGLKVNPPDEFAEYEARISMDGKGRWTEDVFVERFWRSLKCDCVYLHESETGFQALQQIGAWMRYSNKERPHSAFKDQTPLDVYQQRMAA